MAVTNDELARLYHLACMATYSPWYLEAFDRESIDMAHKLHSVIHAQRAALIAWQFQAAGAALALQRLIDAAQAMREAQQAWEDFIRDKQDDCAPAEIREAAYNVGDAEDAFDDLLAGMLKDMETRHGRH